MAYTAVALVGIFLIGGICYGLLEGVRSSRRLGAIVGAASPMMPRNDAFHSFTSTRYFSGLDSLRAISVMAVIWTHVSGVHGMHLFNQGNKGVDLFFAISGFLVTTLLLREYRLNGRISLRDFYIRRTLRIFPLYYAVLALYCLLVFLTLKGTSKGSEFWNNLPAFATYTSNWFVNAENSVDRGVTFYFAWSLATEEQFYLLWPSLMVLLLWKVKKDWVLVVAALALIGMKVAAVPYDGGTLLATVVASLAPAILFGAAFAVLLNNRAAFNVLYPLLARRLSAPAMAVLLLAMLQVDAHWLIVHVQMALLVACVCIREDTHLHPLLTWRPAVFVGTISYGIYLMHMLAANVVRKVLGHASGIDVFVATTLLVILLAYLSFRYFEAPILRLKSRFGAERRDEKNEASLGRSANV